MNCRLLSRMVVVVPSLQCKQFVSVMDDGSLPIKCHTPMASTKGKNELALENNKKEGPMVASPLFKKKKKKKKKKE